MTLKPDYSTAPGVSGDSLERYFEHHIEPGSFLNAVLSNDLFDAIGRADHVNVRALPEICSLVYNYLPSECWGSPSAVDCWLQLHREQDRRDRDSEACREDDKNR